MTVSVDSGNTLCLKMQNRMRTEVDDATVCPSISFAVRVCACIGAHVCMHFYNACMARGSCFRLQLVRPRNRSRILARGELGLQVAYGTGLGGKWYFRSFTPILRQLQYYIFSVGSHCHDIVLLSPFHLHHFHLMHDVPVSCAMQSSCILVRSRAIPNIIFYIINYCYKHARA